MKAEDLRIIEQYFKLLPPDEDSMLLINELIDEVRRQDAEIDKLVAVNRHYLHHFFNGDFDRMDATFKYLKMN